MQPQIVVVYMDHEENLRSKVINLNFDIHEFRIFKFLSFQSLRSVNFIFIWSQKDTSELMSSKNTEDLTPNMFSDSEFRPLEIKDI